jgi:hypothetical protein
VSDPVVKYILTVLVSVKPAVDELKTFLFDGALEGVNSTRVVPVKDAFVASVNSHAFPEGVVITHLPDVPKAMPRTPVPEADIVGTESILLFRPIVPVVRVIALPDPKVTLS